jgi:Tfp pilus assembly protein FimT
MNYTAPKCDYKYEYAYVYGGFTLFETLLVLSLASIIGTLTLTNGISYFNRSMAGIDRAELVAAFREARAEAQNSSNYYGVHVTNAGFVLFEGESYASRKQINDSTFTFITPEVLSSTSSQDTIFEPLSADLQTQNSQSDIVSLIGNDYRTEVIEVLQHGSILSTIL